MAGKWVAVHVPHLAAVNEEVMAAIVGCMSAACGNQVLDMSDLPVSSSAT